MTTAMMEPRSQNWLVPVLAILALLVGADVVGDLKAGAAPPHVGLEVCAMGLALVGVVRLGLQTLSARREAKQLAHDLARITAESERWRKDAESHLKGLADAIDRQFSRWELTPAEGEIALLLLKGLTLKEIAGIRETSERTVRQQSLAIYRKSGLAGRAELSAFFLEDLLQPAASRTSP